ncbi:MAG: AAA family ATPase, partial [Phormidesmis sp.]
MQPGAVIHLRELLLDEDAAQTMISLTDCGLWRLDKTRFQELAEEFPALNQELSRLLADALEEVSEQLAYEQERQQALLPYRVTRVKRGVVGGSRYAIRLRQNIREVTRLD